MTATIQITNRPCAHAELTISYQDGRIEKLPLTKAFLQEQTKTRHPAIISLRNFIKQKNLSTPAQIKTAVEAASFEL
jgi:hypothetical protein